MATAVIMPKQGQSVETCIITKWFKKKGDNISVGDILFSYETDKASFDLEASESGVLLDLYFGEGDEVPVLVNVAVIGEAGEATDSFKLDQPTQKHADSGEEKVEKAEKAEGVADKKEVIHDAKIRISPRARLLAEDKGLAYSNLIGSGPSGRIIARDIEKALSGGILTKGSTHTSGIEYTEQPLSNVRKIIAKAMHSSLQNSAQLTHHMSADARNLLESRQNIKNKLLTDTSQGDITLNDMVCWCVIRALEKFPDANSHFLDDRIRSFHKVHLAIAVDTPRGLMVPVVKNADELDLTQLSGELKKVADSCKKGSIDPEFIQSSAATFTVSNLGNYGVEMFTPVVNLPQAAILGVCTIVNRPASIGNNLFGFVPYIGLSLTYDHRAIDGGPATLFLKEIRDQIEAFIV